MHDLAADNIYINPIQARLFLPFKGPREWRVFREPLPAFISETIKASPMKLLHSNSTT